MFNVFNFIAMQRKTFAVSHSGRSGGLTLDWQSGFSLTEGADATIVWHYKFSGILFTNIIKGLLNN